MITTPAAVLDLLQGESRETHWRLLIEDADGTMRDYADQGGVDWRDSAEWGKTVDSVMADGVVELAREAGGLSLAPMVDGSSLNRNAAGGTAPAIDMGRALEIWVQVTAGGAAAVEADWVLVYDAIIQKVDWAKTLKLSTLDRSSLLNKIIRTDTTYGTPGGTAVETVMQQVIDDNLGVGVFTLQVPTSPGFMVTEYPHGDGTLVGKTVRQALDDLSAAFAGYVDYRAALTLIVPDRTEPTAVSADATIGPEHYKAIPKLDVDLDAIRNVVRVTFRNVATGEVEFVEVTHAGSIAAYDEQFIGITEGDTSPIDTTPEATDMANDVLSDLAVQRVQQQVQDWFFYPVELGDHITWKANGKHYDTDQHWAVTGYRHRLSRTARETTFDVRGAASGGYRRWIRRAGTGVVEERIAEITGLEGHVTSASEVKAVVVANDEAANIYVTVGVGSTPLDPTAGANDGTLAGRSGTIATGITAVDGSNVTIKAVAADAAGALGPVQSVTFAAYRRMTIPEGLQRSKGGQNLLPLDAGTEEASTAASWKVMTVTLADADLDVGDVVSFSGELDRGAAPDQVRLVLRFLDVSSGVLATHVSPNATTAAYERLELADKTIPASTVTIQAYAENPTLTGASIKARRFMLNEGPIPLTFKRPPLRKGRGTPEDLWPTKYVGEVPTHVRNETAGTDVPGSSVFDKTADDAADVAYDSPASGVTIQSLKPAEAGAEVNPPAIESADVSVADTGTDDIYSASWSVSDAVTGSYNVRIRYYKGSALVQTNTVVATNLSEIHTETGAGNGVADLHHGDLQLLDSGGNAVGGMVETRERQSTI